jgi:hypothetical protein
VPNLDPVTYTVILIAPPSPEDEAAGLPSALVGSAVIAATAEQDYLVQIALPPN